MTDEHTSTADRAVPINEIAATALDEPEEFAGGERLYAVLFEDDYEAVSLDPNGDVALLLTREQAEAARDVMDDLATALAGDRSLNDREEHEVAKRLGPDNNGIEHVRCSCGVKYPATSGGCPIAPAEVYDGE